mgnify:CR=1 FL=1
MLTADTELDVRAGGAALGHGGPVIDAGTLGRLAALGLDLQFDIYFPSDDDDL